MSREADDGRSRIPALDGIRGIAILMVLLNHFFPNRNYAPSHVMTWLSNAAQSGWAGVDLFFVLSGFLITGILIESKNSPHFFRNFYMRRVLRIFPLYYGALAVVFLILPALGLFDWSTFGSVWRNQAWNWSYCTNVGMWRNDAQGFYSPQVNLGHLWTLAIEEHFYLVWPAVVFALPSRALKAVCIGGAFLVLAARTVAVIAYDASHVFFFLTPCRADSLMLGAFMAALAADGALDRQRAAILRSGALASLILFGVFLRWRCLPARDPLMHSGGYSLLSITSAALVVLAVTRPGLPLVESLFAAAPLRFFGKYSYGLYIIHGLLSPILSTGLSDTLFIGATHSVVMGVFACVAARIALCTAAAFLSWHLFEKRFLGLKRYFRKASEGPAMFERAAS